MNCPFSVHVAGLSTVRGHFVCSSEAWNTPESTFDFEGSSYRRRWLSYITLCIKICLVALLDREAGYLGLTL